MQIKDIVELLCWNNCNGHCRFCFMHYHHHKNKFLSDGDKAVSLNKALALLNSPTYKDGSHVLLVGGELFDTKFSRHTEKVFRNFLETIVSYMVCGKIDLLYVNTNLIYENTDYLYYLLRLIDKQALFPRLKFTTSYDIYGRFLGNERALFERNLSAIKKDFPEIRIVVNMIMTKQFCEAVLSDNFSVKNFKEKYHVDVNTIPYIILHEDMAAERTTIFNTLIKLDYQMPGYLSAYVDNVALDQKKLLYEYDGKEYRFMTAKDSACGHNENFLLYTKDHKHCFICDMLNLKEVACV